MERVRGSTGSNSLTRPACPDREPISSFRLMTAPSDVNFSR
jgi:hypothetical protein